MRAAGKIRFWGGIALMLALAVGGCTKIKQNDPQKTAQTRATAKRQKAACASSAAYDHLKSLVFDQAIAKHAGDRTNLDTLADYSAARMEDPVVEGWDPSLDITRCKGRFILELPPGTEAAFAGEKRLQADVVYTAQAAADDGGLVYRLDGAQQLVTQLAEFNLNGGAYRPPAAIDEPQQAPSVPETAAIVRAEVPEPRLNVAAAQGEPAAAKKPRPPARPRAPEPELASNESPSGSVRTSPVPSTGGSSEATVRAFYNALGRGNGDAASAQIIPEKRASGAFSPAAMSGFYGRLAEPLRLTEIVPLARDSYRVSYRYSSGRSRCDGRATVSLSNRSGRYLIRSIRAQSGC